ncbi:MAG: signal recognition particle-docking protein FtsY [Cellulomonadaceae bacterium]|jgi:fused signal recognition particle receptor|nr:signal recognition particle-docking protein FtsY [Cellulomonadaceae bacterium]
MILITPGALPIAVWIFLATALLIGISLLLWALLVRPRKLKKGRSIAELRANAPTAPHVTKTTQPGLAAGPGVGAGAQPGSRPIVPSLDTPEATATRLGRLRSRLARSGSPLGARLLSLLSRDHLTEGDWDQIEETLLVADVGAGPAEELVQALKTRVRVEGTAEPTRVRAMLREELIKLVDPTMDRSLNLVPKYGVKPAVILVVGVNGTGKTTTIGKLSRALVADGHTVLLGAADTFRAAAADQLQTWGKRVGVETVRADRDGADPAAVAFEAVQRGKEEAVDVVVVDTAGRLQNKTGLMDELGKITRVINSQAELNEVLLVLDATTGQNGMQQARVFSQVAGVTGIVLTKLDGTAKGGIVISVQRELGVPVKLIGLGEGPDDLAPFDAAQFVDGILG